jgi:hypothetical protein
MGMNGGLQGQLEARDNGGGSCYGVGMSEGERMRVWGGRREVATVLNASMGHVSHFGATTNDVAGSGWPVWSCHLL